MSKKKSSAKKMSRPSRSSALRPEQLYERFIDSDDDKERLSFQRRYDELRDRAMQTEADADSASLLSLLNRLDPFAGVEASIRLASFVQGFEMCASLLTKGGSR
jgi:hypothetical protein